MLPIIAVFVKTPPLAVKETNYGNVVSEKLLLPTRNTRDIITAAIKALDRIFLESHRYTKAGVMLNDFTPFGASQLSLFDEVQPRENRDELMKILDELNHSGLRNIWFVGQRIAPE